VIFDGFVHAWGEEEGKGEGGNKAFIWRHDMTWLDIGRTGGLLISFALHISFWCNDVMMMNSRRIRLGAELCIIRIYVA